MFVLLTFAFIGANGLHFLTPVEPIQDGRKSHTFRQFHRNIIMKKGASAPNILAVIVAERRFTALLKALLAVRQPQPVDWNAMLRQSFDGSAEHPNLHPKRSIRLGYSRL